MNTILTEIKNLKVEDWDYYNRNERNGILNNPFDNKSDHLSFIEEYFKRGGKEKIIFDIIKHFEEYGAEYGAGSNFNVKDFLRKRAAHSNTVFFIGILLYRNTILKNYIDECFVKDADNRNFLFCWFLTALFHDFGYYYEKKSSNFRKIIDIETLKKFFKIKYNLLNYKKIKCIHADLYSCIRNYLLYRRFNSKHENKIDHGILAGLLLYDALLKNRIEHEKNNDYGLYWGRKLNKFYAQIAAVIATHNIWLPTNEDLEEYKKFGMDSLINMRPLKINESPLLFLLGIVDTIDPVKIYRNYEQPNTILNRLLISYTSNQITIAKADSKGPNLDFSKIIDRTRNLSNWLDVCIKSEVNKIKITLKNHITNGVT